MKIGVRPQVLSMPAFVLLYFQINDPVFVPLDLALLVCVAPGYFRSDVKARLLETFSRRELAGGRQGFFHPDQFTFGQPVYLSRIYEAAMAVAGVSYTPATFDDVNEFQLAVRASKSPAELIAELRAKGPAAAGTLGRRLARWPAPVHATPI